MSTPFDRIDANLCAIEDDLKDLARSSPNRETLDQIADLHMRAMELFSGARNQIVDARYEAAQQRLARDIKFYEEIARA